MATLSSDDINRWASAGPHPLFETTASTIDESAPVPLPALVDDVDEEPDEEEIANPISRAEITIASSALVACALVSASSADSRLHSIIMPPVDTSCLMKDSYL